MTRKDYELIASALSIAAEMHPGFNQALSDAAFEISNALKADNQRFNERRFQKACGIEYTVQA